MKEFLRWEHEDSWKMKGVNGHRHRQPKESKVLEGERSECACLDLVNLIDSKKNNLFQ